MRLPRRHAWRTGTSSLLLLVRVTPKSTRDAVEGLTDTADGPALKVRVRAVAEDGQANKSVEQVVARWLGVPRTRVNVAHGGKSRVKTLSVEGKPDELELLLAARISAFQ